jgi:2-polyprenyl-3-methyl-5-hydroxy-6-metoxy-1,4-benzoquinol methylase
MIPSLQHAFTRLRQYFSPLGPTDWDRHKIKDEWFGAHFNYAADVVAEWIGISHLASGPLLDFGCGDGITLLSLILQHQVPLTLGVDISRTHEGLAQLAKNELGLNRLPHQLHFQKIQAGEQLPTRQRFASIFSWSTFEHISRDQMPGILSNLHELLTDDGLLFIQINPLYYSPMGSHLGRFGLPPWAHLSWSAEQVKDAVMQFKGQIPAEELEENFLTRSEADYKSFVLSEYDALNRINCDELQALLLEQGFEIVRQQRCEVASEPPADLLSSFSREHMKTEELRILLRRKPHLA